MLGVFDRAREDIATPYGLTRAQLFSLPVIEKSTELLTSVEVALKVSPGSLGRAFTWLGTHRIRPVGRQFEGPCPGLLWNRTEVELHEEHAAVGCGPCSSFRENLKQKVS